MKKIATILIILFTFMMAAAQNTAVLIGVSVYPEGSGWCKINAHNDISLLKTRVGKSANIIILEDFQATHDNIVNTLKGVAQSSQKGDTVFVHFSCHGQQMLPLMQDISEVDGLDEAIIPYDAQIEWSESYDGRHHLRDNELSGIVNELRSHIGPDGLVVVSLDACHSDSMDKDASDKIERNGTIYRGTTDVFGENVTDEALKKRYWRDTTTISSEGQAPVVYLSACKSQSKNAEIVLKDGTGCGSLSYAVSEALSSHGLNDIKSFLDCVVKSMSGLVPYQDPGIRASFRYEIPAENPDTDETMSIIEASSNNLNRCITYAVLGILALVSAVLLFCKRGRSRQ